MFSEEFIQVTTVSLTAGTLPRSHLLLKAPHRVANTPGGYSKKEALTSFRAREQAYYSLSITQSHPKTILRRTAPLKAITLQL